MPFFLGIDCGGTTTRAAVADGVGHVIGFGFGGASNPNVLRSELVAKNITHAIELALRQARIKPADLAAVFLGIAGVNSDSERAQARSLLAHAGLEPQTPIGIDHDIRIALAGGLPGRDGLALIVGTGSSCYGRTADGRTWKTGGWGPVLDDIGSAAGLGYAALRAAVRMTDGRLHRSNLADQVMAALGFSRMRDVVERLYKTGMSSAEIAALAPIVINAWHNGDDAAAKIIQTGADELSLIVATTAAQLALAAPLICCCGGVIENSSKYRQRIATAIQLKFPDATLAAPALPPVLGAILLAYELCGQMHDASTWAKLRQSYPTTPQVEL